MYNFERLCDDLLIEIFTHIIDETRYVIPLQIYLNKNIYNIITKKIKSLHRHIYILDDRGITDDILKNMNHLDSIYIESIIITDEGIKNLTNLTSLVLFDANAITDEGIKYLTNLEHLTINYADNITDEGVKFLINLQSLTLGTKNVTISCLNNLKNLEFLELYVDEKSSLSSITHFDDMKDHPNFSNMKMEWSF